MTSSIAKYEKNLSDLSQLDISLTSILANIKTKNGKLPIFISKEVKFEKLISGNLDKIKACFHIDASTKMIIQAVEEKCKQLLLGKKFKGWHITENTFKSFFTSSVQDEFAIFTISESECAFFRKNLDKNELFLDNGIFCIETEYISEFEKMDIVIQPAFMWFVDSGKMGLTWKIIQIAPSEKNI